MSRDRSLDEFLPGGSDDERESEEPADAGTTGGADGTDDADAGAGADADSDGPDESDTDVDAAGDAPTELVVRPAESTMDWAPGGAACETCGTPVERRWRDGDRLVCADCKEW